MHTGWCIEHDTEYNRVRLLNSNVLLERLSLFMIAIMIAELSTFFLACFGVFFALQVELYDLIFNHRKLPLQVFIFSVYTCILGKVSTRFKSPFSCVWIFVKQDVRWRLHDSIFNTKMSIWFWPSVYLQTMKMHTQNGLLNMETLKADTWKTLTFHL